MSDYEWWQERCDGMGISQSLKVKLLHREQSPFQLVEIYDHEDFGRLLVLDGYIQASQADEFIYHEMGMHVPLLGRERKDANVLIIGGGDGGNLREALVHDFVKSVTMVEIDERVIRLSEEYLGVNGDYNDPRVNLVIDDAKKFVSNAKERDEKFDVIILDLTEPVGPSAVLFTEAFFTDLVEIVSDTGVVVDSDSVFLTLHGGGFLQEQSGDGENLVSVMLKTRLLPHMEAYRANVPLYPGGDFGFYLYSKDGVSLRHPVMDHQGKHYDADVHQASFALPKWQRDWLDR
ncbi:spermine/spermidine synthase domain-containing protein [Curvivirga aplysinae]|uniref:spermine/spermidine synthase domain-containing protein n=1 Tax=Curvivirga aplysinae TaxID=2529852 RepID=UPI001C3FCB4C|nr:hypothetical protein [Curvivirga aplysinae]